MENDFIDYAGNTLVYMADVGNYDMVCKLLFPNAYDMGDVNITDIRRNLDKALIKASKRGNTDIMRLLLGYGADPKAHDPDTNINGAPLRAASMGRHKEAVKLLMEYGACKYEFR